MPKNDTWPGDTGLETMDGMDSAGSCDSVVSANSGFVSNWVYLLESNSLVFLFLIIQHNFKYQYNLFWYLKESLIVSYCSLF